MYLSRAVATMITHILLAFAVILLVATTPHASALNALHSFDFNTPSNAEGWAPTNTSFIVSNGTATGTATTGDPQVARSGFSFPGNASSGVLVRYRGSHNGNAQLFWGRTGADNYSADRVVTVNYPGNGEWRTLFLSPKGHAEWDDRTITRLRIDPAGGTGSTFEIDWFRVLSWDYNNDGVPDHIKGGQDSNGNGLLDLEDFDADGDRIPDGWARSIANAPGSVRFDFDETDNAEGWAAGGDLTLLDVENGSLTAEVTGPDPQLIRGRLHLQAALIDGLIIRVQSPSPGDITLFWTHDCTGGGSFDAARSMTVAVPAAPDGARSAYFDLREANEWKGKLITALRIDPDFPNGTVISIEHAHTSCGDYDRDGIPDLTEEPDDSDGDGLADFEDIDSDGDGVSDAGEMRRGWNPYDPIEATRDSDGDGVPDAAEAIAGTDPDHADERPVTRNRTGGQRIRSNRPGPPRTQLHPRAHRQPHRVGA